MSMVLMEEKLGESSWEKMLVASKRRMIPRTTILFFLFISSDLDVNGGAIRQ